MNLEIPSRGRGPDNVYFKNYYFLSSTYFKEGRTDIHREANGPKGSICFSRGDRIRILRKPIAACNFPGSLLPYGSALDIVWKLTPLITSRFIGWRNLQCCSMKRTFFFGNVLDCISSALLSQLVNKMKILNTVIISLINLSLNIEWIGFRVLALSNKLTFVIRQLHRTIQIKKKQVSMIRKYQNHTLQTNQRNSEEDLQNNNNHQTPGRQLKQSNQLYV